MSKESNEEKLSRVREMASGSETWDLSRNDLAALKYVLSLVDGASRPAPVEVRGVVTPPSEEEWAGVMRVDWELCKHGRTWSGCKPCVTEHNARLAALRAKVEAERERTRRVAAAAVAYVSAPDESDELPDMYAALRAAVRALRGEP